jgi:hypothetical protein
MSLLKLEKSLYNLRKRVEPAPETRLPSGAGYLVLATRVISAIRRSVFVGETFSDLSAQLETIRKDLHVESEPTVLSENANLIEKSLEAFHSRTREENQGRANDFRNVLDILNETFSHLHSGSEKSGGRLKALEAGLSRAAKIDDLAALRTHMSQMLEFVRQEGKRDQLESEETLESLGQQIQQAHTAISRFRLQMPDRADAIAHLTSQLANVETSADLHVALFVIDSLRAIRIRHGEEIALHALEDLGRKKIPHLDPRGKVFCWSPTSILLVWRHADEKTAPGDLPARLQSPLEHRAFVGTRIATFTLAVRSVVMAAAGPVDEIVWALDRFWKGGSGC